MLSLHEYTIYRAKIANLAQKQVCCSSACDTPSPKNSCHKKDADDKKSNYAPNQATNNTCLGTRGLHSLSRGIDMWWFSDVNSHMDHDGRTTQA